MKLTTLTAALAVGVTFAQTAHAREHHYGHGVHHRYGAYHATWRHAVAHRYTPADKRNFSAPWTGQNDQSGWGGGNYQQASNGENRRPARRSRSFALKAAARSAGTTDHGGLGGRPRAWCGWEMRQLVGGDPGPEYNLARNWAGWGHAGPAGVGAVVVWAHHVGKIVGQEGGQWIIQSGNDGNRVRTRPLPIGRAIAIRWG
jgi:hypothetical protein